MNEQVEKADLKDREYQRNIIDVCISRNSIVYLPTGAGKTYIAIQVIKHFSDSIKNPYIDGGKRSFFLTNTVALAEQQAQRIRELIPFNVGLLTGENNVDSFIKQDWVNELNKHEILVMTAQCFADAVDHTYIDLKLVNVIIFDECHHGRKGNVYRQIMQKMDDDKIVQSIRIIGLSGMLIGIDNSTKPETVHNELKSIENVYQSTIITVNNINDRKNVLIYSTKAKEFLISYDSTLLHDCLSVIRAQLLDLQNYLNPIELNNFKTISSKTLRPTKPGKINDLIKMLKDFDYQSEILGCYGSYLALLSILVQLELAKRFSDTEKYRDIVKICISKVECCINYIKREMGFDKKDAKTVMKNSSIKVQTLLLLLKKFFEDPNREKDMQCLIFTKRRSSAKILYHLIKCYGNDTPNFPIKPDFVIGRNNSMPESIEGILTTSNNTNALEKFENKETNVIVCTNVLEEGIDLQACNLVIVYDQPETPCSYVQSRGRARDNKSNYILMLNSNDIQKFKKKYQRWQEIDFALKKQLIGRTIDRPPPSDEDIKKEQAQEWEPFCTKEGACLTALNCIPILNQYAQSLPGDRFTNPSVNWSRIDHDDGKVSVRLTLPIQSMLNNVITGNPRNIIKVAKQDAAFKACKMLYENGNLTEQLSPVCSEIKIEEFNPKYFNHWNKYVEENPKKTGNKNNLRLYDVQIPKAIDSCGPIIGSNILYRISIRPKFDDNNNALKAFYKLLANDNTFGILTTKRIPKLSIITLFQSYGEIECEISELPTIADIDCEGSLKKLQQFHINIFRDILKIFQNYFVLDKTSYLIVPINEYNEIDWTLVNNFQTISKPALMTREQIDTMTFNDEDYIYKVVNPVYRQYTDQNYVVINIIHHKSPLSMFPNNEYNMNYSEYFKEKWQVDIRRNDQFMLEVKGIGKNLKLFFPGSSISGKQKKYERINECEEYIPEICHNYKFPADYWLKATLLPSILHRMTYLLLAEELRQWLIKEDIDSGCGQQIYKLDIDYGDYDTRTEIMKMAEHESTEKIDNFIDILKRVKQGQEESSQKKSTAISKVTLLNNNRSSLPIDLERQMLNITDVDLDYYYQFITKNNNIYGSNLTMLKGHEKCKKTKKELPALKERKICKDIKLLHLNKYSGCIQQKDLIKVITTAKSGDVFDMERYEALGDAFLKFITSLFLYKTHGNWHEGHLSALKGKMVSNRNLYYIGNDFGLPKMLNSSNFDVQSLLAPSTKLPMNLKDILVKNKRLLPYLLDLNESLSNDEIHSGLMKDENLNLFKMNNLMDINESEDSINRIDKAFIGFIDQKVIGDKIIADCVEALLGCTVSSVGIDATYKLCQKLKILPETKNLLTETIYPRIVHDSDLTITNKKLLETKIGYTFKEEVYLTQALTHASYPNQASGTYQQLEFLGDAVLDFLITSFIYENCPKMDPGKLTDLRSALVNNVTLACIIVRNGIHKHMNYENYVLAEAIKKFDKFQESNNYEVTDQVEIMNTENDTSIAKAIDVPKALGDIFESIVGAIFLDTNLSLKNTWDVIYKLMEHEILKFMHDVPIQITRRLFEFQGGIAKPKFYATEVIEGDENIAVPLKIKTRDGGEKIFVGFGKNRKIAKEAAAKKALNELM